MDEKGNEYARTGIATHVILHRRGTRSYGEGKVVLGSAELSYRQRVEDMVGGPRDDREPGMFGHGERGTGPHGFTKGISSVIMRKLTVPDCRKRFRWLGRFGAT